MNVVILSLVILVVAMLVLSAFFSGLEIAFISVNRLRVELKSNQGKHWAKLCSAYIKKPSKFISTILVGNNITLVIYGVAMERLLQPVFSGMPEAIALILATIVSTIVVLILAEFLPKALFRLNPSGILSVLIYPFQLFYVLLWPFVQFIIWLSKLILEKLFRADFTEQSPVFTKIDLDHFISQSAQHAEGDEESEFDTDMLKNALDFGTVRVRDCLVPRTELVAVDINSTVEELFDLFVQTQHSKILVYEDNIDNIIGYTHHIDLQKRPKSIRSILLSIPITNESQLAKDMLNEFSRTQKSIGLVVDEYGGTAGIITIEDIMEEIFGEIEDEHDNPVTDEDVVVLEGSYIIKGKGEVDILNERYDLKIPEGDYESVGGYIVSRLEDIPGTGGVFVIDNFEIKILEASENRIERIQLTILD